MRAALGLGAKVPEYPMPASAGGAFLRAEWSEDDALAFHAWVRSDLGRRFLERIQAVGVAVAVNGARNTVHTVHSAGVSAGWDEAVRYINSLSRVSGVQDTNDGRPLGETDLLEQLSP